jgi:TM2 domain-containing membrane protein YozV
VIVEPKGDPVSLVVRCPSCLTEASVPDELHGKAVLCPACQMRFTAPDGPPPLPKADPKKPLLPPPPADERKYCTECGSAIRRKAVVCPACGVAQGAMPVSAGPTLPYQPAMAVPTSGPNRIVTGVLALVLGIFGVHKFMLGYVGEGFLMLVLGIVGAPCTGGVLTLVIWGISLAEGIIYLTKSDAEFHQMYVVNQKRWF